MDVGVSEMIPKAARPTNGTALYSEERLDQTPPATIFGSAQGVYY